MGNTYQMVMVDLKRQHSRDGPLKQRNPLAWHTTRLTRPMKKPLPFPFEQHNVQQDYNAHEGLKGLAPYDLGHKNARLRPNDSPIPINPRLHIRVLVAHRILRRINTGDLDSAGEAGIKAELLGNLWNLDLKTQQDYSRKVWF